MNDESRKQFKAIIEQMRFVYKHDSRPWMIGYSGGKDSTLLCQLVFETLESLPPSERKEGVYRDVGHHGRKPDHSTIYA